MIRDIIQIHGKAILTSFRNQLCHISNKIFSPPGIVELIIDGIDPIYFNVKTPKFICVDKTQALQVHLCGDEVVIITLDTRTGKLNLRDTRDLAAAGRGPRFAGYSDKINENPTVLLDSLIRLRLTVSTTIFVAVRMLNAPADDPRLC